MVEPFIDSLDSKNSKLRFDQSFARYQGVCKALSKVLKRTEVQTDHERKDLMKQLVENYAQGAFTPFVEGFYLVIIPKEMRNGDDINELRDQVNYGTRLNYVTYKIGSEVYVPHN